MVIMSDQHFISRASMLFSMYNLSGSGFVTPPELFIGLRTLYKGLSHTFTHFACPAMADIEALAGRFFSKAGKQDSICLGEILIFVYQSRYFMELAGPFRS